MYRTKTLLSALVIALVGCASGPAPIYSDVDIRTKPNASAVVVGRSVSQGPELVVLLNAKTNEVTKAIRGISLNREQVFVIALEPGTYVVHRLGIHGAPIGAKDEPFRFTLVAGDVVYVGTFVNEWHPPSQNEVVGRVVKSRLFGPTACVKLLCSGYLDDAVRSPYARVGIVDESASLLPRVQAEVPTLRNVSIMTRLAD